MQKGAVSSDRRKLFKHLASETKVVVRVENVVHLSSIRSFYELTSTFTNFDIFKKNLRRKIKQKCIKTSAFSLLNLIVLQGNGCKSITLVLRLFSIFPFLNIFNVSSLFNTWPFPSIISKIAFLHRFFAKLKITQRSISDSFINCIT